MAGAAFDPTLVVPTGNVVGAFFVLVATFVTRVGWRTRLLALVLALAATVLPHLLPDAALPEEPRLAFLLGFVPPVAAAAFVVWLRKRREAAPAAPPGPPGGP
jgi:hypothetical protein